MKARALISLLTLLVVVPTALAWPGPPKSARPKPPNPGAPPPAWIETQTKSAWLAFGSYCWKTACVDMIPPNSRPDLPGLTSKRGSTIRVHLGFAAKSVEVDLGTKPINAKLDPTKRIIFWGTTRGGILSVSARAQGSASYVARLRVG
jgi:hypothetical protein